SNYAAVGIYDSTGSTQHKGTESTAPNTGASWLRISYTFLATNGRKYYPCLYGRRSAAGSAIKIYFDDVVMFTSTYSSTDLSAPTKAKGISTSPALLSTSLPFNWTAGTDAQSGIDGALILRVTGIDGTTPTVSDQT